MSSSIKHYGRIYTPDYLVKRMLDFGNYRFGATQCRHVIDNSCGNGAFLTEIVRRYIVEFLERSNDLKLLQSELETFVHGVEIDCDEYAKCLHNLDKTAAEYGLSNVRWDIINADALTLRQFDNKMEFVFGNPPYVRVHNLSDNYNSVKMYEFAEKGMTDLFIVFFEIGFNMLSEQGTMVLITPSSWLSSKAGGKLRNYIMRKNNLSGVIDLGHFQPFNAATYTLISRFQPTETFDKIDYYTFDSNELKEKFQTSLSLKQIDINGEFYLGSESTLLQLKEIKDWNQLLVTFIKVLHGQDIYKSIEEKGANFLYLIVKNHVFADGNKRIAATLFIYFLNFYGILYKNGKQVIDNNTLTALTLLIAESNPKEKEIIIDLVMNFLNNE